MKEQQIFLGSCVFLIAWIYYYDLNSPACMPKWSNDYEIKKNRSSLLHRSDLWSGLRTPILFIKR